MCKCGGLNTFSYKYEQVIPFSTIICFYYIRIMFSYHVFFTFLNPCASQFKCNLRGEDTSSVACAQTPASH